MSRRPKKRSPHPGGGKASDATEHEVANLISSFEGPLFTAVETEAGVQLGRRFKTLAHPTPLGIWIESEPFDIAAAQPVTLRIYHRETGGSPIYSVHREDGIEEGTCLSAEWSLLSK
jgi:hypothetical protein